jgi:hypothetical protein
MRFRIIVRSGTGGILKERHEAIHELINWIEPAYGSFINGQDWFPEVLNGGAEVYSEKVKLLFG